MDKNIVLDIDAIINQEFSIDFKGYSPIEVDQFLDTVARDYVAYQNHINYLNETIANLEKKQDELNERIIELSTQLGIAEEDKANAQLNPAIANQSQIDILRRLAKLEQEVFNNRK